MAPFFPFPLPPPHLAIIFIILTQINLLKYCHLLGLYPSMALHYRPKKSTFLILIFKALHHLSQILPAQSYFPLFPCPFAKPIGAPSISHNRHYTFLTQELSHAFLTSFLLCFQLPVFFKVPIRYQPILSTGRRSGSIPFYHSLSIQHFLFKSSSTSSQLVY